MATLDDFGFAKGRRSKQQQTNSKTFAFIPPSFDNNKDLIKKKPLVNQHVQNKTKKKSIKTQKQTNTITQYFAPMADVLMKEVEEEQDDNEEPVIICTIRNKKSFIEDFWNVILKEYEQEELLEESEDEEQELLTEEEEDTILTKRKRDEEQVIVLCKKKKKKLDIDLAHFMNRFLNIKENCKLKNNSNIMFELHQNITAMKEDEDEQEEDLTRTIRKKLTILESRLLFEQITKELLLLS